MTDKQLHNEVELQIRKPCPKIWSELAGDERKRFCSECSLHVHNAAQLSQHEARELVASAGSRVCMRIEYDASGAPIFRDTVLVDAGSAPVLQARPARRTLTLARWALSAAAGVLAACHGSLSAPASSEPATSPNVGQPPSRMGRMSSTAVLGDVAGPPTQGPQRLGELMIVPAPPTNPSSAKHSE